MWGTAPISGGNYPMRNAKHKAPKGKIKLTWISWTIIGIAFFIVGFVLPIVVLADWR